MSTQMRHSGVEVLGDMPWGTHFCQFYQTLQDLLDVLVDYFRQGLENNEFCVWVTSEPLGVEEASSALRRVVPDLNERARRGQIEFWDYREWFAPDGHFDADPVRQCWFEKERAALAQGYNGLRISEDMSWLDKSHWKTFTDYESTVNDVVGSHRILALCTYSLDQYSGVEMLDVLRNHPLVLVRKDGEWEVIRSPQQRKTEESLRQSEERFRFLVEAIPFGAWMCDAQGRNTYISPSFLKKLGMTAEHVRDFGWTDSLAPEDLGEPLDRWRHCVQTGEDWEGEWHFRMKDGTYRTALSQGSPVRDSQGQIVGWVGIDLDITDRKRAEEEKLELERRLLHAQKLESLGILAGGIAHDFNNILAGIMGYADLAMVNLPATEPVRANIEVIREAVWRAADLTRQMLAYSGKGKFVVEPLSLSLVVERSKKMLAMSVSKKAMVTYNLASNLPVIQADAAQMCQVVMNLVINASEALGERSGVIAVSTNAARCEAKDLALMVLGHDLPEGLYVSLEVGDTGCGMDEQTLSHIFDPFFTTKFTGRGLGMAAVHGIVRGHKGAIRVSSEPGKGTTLQVLFPASGPSAPVERTELATIPARSSGMVLVVDDDKMVRLLVQQMLEHAGFSSLMANSGREAIRLFREHQHEVSCVLLDLSMPDLDGAETFLELHRIRPDVRVILSSGYGEEVATERFVGQSLAGFIQKPYQLDMLIARIHAALGGADGPPS